MARRVIPHSEYRQLSQMLTHALGSSDEERNDEIQRALDDLNRAYLLRGKDDYERRFQRAARKSAAHLTYEYDLRQRLIPTGRRVRLLLPDRTGNGEMPQKSRS